ncbi:T-cell surface glycoprotein CD1a-like isoform X1 [Lutra lutra]|uniref:T-cell surface glycoprotein CD1a-like isoform X1 n=1 Tax=Lutra lutra TaxID=9657 RepID=UPI001FD61E33|nr:T-cell surface glycoprotein CD1a-like isoform X1 [Lutra lutra]
MLFLQLVLLVVLLPGSDSEAVQEPITFQITLTVSFYNHSWTQSLGSAWLDEIQTHGWDNKTGALIFLWPWSKGNWSHVELMKLEKLLYAYFIGLRQVFQDHVRHWQLEYPFQIQLAEGCELHFGEASVGFVKFAYQGADLTSFQNMTWWPSPKGGSRAQEVCKLFNQHHVINEEIYTLFSDTCPKFLLGLLDAGKADLQRQVRPEAWLSTGPSPSPDRLLLVCHVSGFYPKPVLVMWMRGEQEQQRTQQSEVLPHADGTWYLQVSLDVKTREAAGLLCRVRHSSLGGQDMVLYWGVSLPFRLSSALLLPVAFPWAILSSTCCRMTLPLFLPGKHSGDISALASLWSEILTAPAPVLT